MSSLLTLGMFFFLSYATCVASRRSQSKFWDKEHRKLFKQGFPDVEKFEMPPPPKKSDLFVSPILDSNHTRHFDVEVVGLENGFHNATVVLHAPEEFEDLVLRYVVAYWPKLMPGHWNERFSGARDQKNRVVIDQLQPGLHYKILVTALLVDGTHEQVRTNFSNFGQQQFPGNKDTRPLPPRDGNTNRTIPHLLKKVPSGDGNRNRLPPFQGSCKSDVTNWERVNKTKLRLKWSRGQCSDKRFSQFVIIYSSGRDYRRVIAGINESEIVIGGLFEEPSEVMVEALTAELELDSIAPVVNTTSSVVVTTRDTNALLISVIILAILFISSAIVAIYLCLYLKMHQHEMARDRSDSRKRTVAMPTIENTGRLDSLSSDGRPVQIEALDDLQQTAQL